MRDILSHYYIMIHFPSKCGPLCNDRSKKMRKVYFLYSKMRNLSPNRISLHFCEQYLHSNKLAPYWSINFINDHFFPHTMPRMEYRLFILINLIIHDMLDVIPQVESYCIILTSFTNLINISCFWSFSPQNMAPITNIWVLINKLSSIMAYISPFLI